MSFNIYFRSFFLSSETRSIQFTTTPHLDEWLKQFSCLVKTGKTFFCRLVAFYVSSPNLPHHLNGLFRHSRVGRFFVLKLNKLDQTSKIMIENIFAFQRRSDRLPSLQVGTTFQPILKVQGSGLVPPKGGRRCMSGRTFLTINCIFNIQPVLFQVKHLFSYF